MSGGEGLFLIAMSTSVVWLTLLTVVILLSRHKKMSVRLHLMGQFASVMQTLTPTGAVLVGGELWVAHSKTGEEIACGYLNVRIVGARGHQLEVETVR